MSAQFRDARNKHSQADLRRFMKEHKNKAKGVPEQKIESPLAKYNEAGQLTCILCKSVVRSAKVWIVHTNGKQHRKNVELAKQLKERTKNFTKPLKRPLSPVESDETHTKKPKSILKNPIPNTSTSKASMSSNDAIPNGDVPADFFDNKPQELAIKSNAQPLKETAGVAMEIEPAPSEETLPEGFFDDPKLDAKARNIEYKDPIEEEWERFQKEIKNADHESEAIIADDQEEATTERQIDEIDEQMKNWSRVLSLEKKKVEVVSNVEEPIIMEEDSSVSGDEFDEYFDWRSKKC